MTPFVGEVKIFPWDWPPRGWALCSGQLMAISQNQALFALIGTMYGGDGRTTFALPDLRGRTAIDRSPQEPQGAIDGTEQVTITIGTMPTHTHALIGTSAAAAQKSPGSPVAGTFGTDNSPASDFYAADTNPLVSLAPATIGQTGGSQPHNNMQPYLVLNYCIALTGAFPSRN